ncbi:MAG TPA: hypothetical protein PLT75_18040 [Spirochaetota bacterium]|nr:hypothetical protein [Spirochaetota bacterium]
MPLTLTDQVNSVRLVSDHGLYQINDMDHGAELIFFRIIGASIDT